MHILIEQTVTRIFIEALPDTFFRQFYQIHVFVISRVSELFNPGHVVEKGQEAADDIKKK